jgi:hypothetical protein
VSATTTDRAREYFGEYFQYRDGLLFRKSDLSKPVGYPNGRGRYLYVNFKGKQYAVHKIIYALFTGIYKTGREYAIDHLDGNRHNNKIENLKLVIKRENDMNLKCHREGKLVGASLRKKYVYKKWQARLRVNGITKSLGFFRTEKEAHDAYMQAVAKLGEA